VDGSAFDLEHQWSSLDLHVERLLKNMRFAVANNIGARMAGGTVNRRPAYYRVENSFIQGRYGSITIAGQVGGGLYAAGDGNRMYGQNGVSQDGTTDQNRATVVVNNVVFYDFGRPGNLRNNRHRHRGWNLG
jgi:hypothetical protein